MPRLRREVYLDNNATTKVSKQVLKSVDHVMWDDQLYGRYVYNELKLNPEVNDQFFKSLD